MIKNVKIRILAFFMAVTLSFCVVSSEYQEVKALEWAGTVVAFDTAIKAILGLLGVGVAVGTASQIDWGQLKDDCVDYQIAQGNNSALVGKWWNDVINGALDTGSDCWVSFKEWVKNDLLSSNSSGGSSGIISATNIQLISSIVPNATGIIDYQELYSCGYYYIETAYPNTVGFSLFENGYNITNITSNTFTISSPVQKNNYFCVVRKSDGVLISQSHSVIPSTVTTEILSRNNYYLLNSPYSETELQAINSHLHVWDGNIELPSESDFESSVSDLGAIGLAPDVATDLPYDGVIDIPWENVGATDTAIDDAFDDALDKVNTGTWTLDQYWTWVQNVTNVFAYDTTNNFLLPNDGDDEKADDKIQQNINRGAMVLYGLEKVFPFCIPWDIYAFVNLLVADPVAPVIEYPIYNPVSGEDEIIIIDFSVWESQVILMRYIQDFLLIIGLLLLARSLIGAGGSD